MGLGVLEDNHLEHVPGTALLTDVIGADNQHHRGGLDTSLLRHDKGRNSDVLLVPQPSRSPNDPLNWPLWKKDLMLFLICIDTAVVGAWVRILSLTIAITNNIDLGTHDFSWLCFNERTVPYILQYSQWWPRLGHLCDRNIMLLYKLNGCDLGSPTYFSTGEYITIY